MGELIDRDQEHLRLLQIAFYIMAAVSGVIPLFSTIYIGLGGVFAAGVMNGIPDVAKEIPPLIGWVFVAIGIFFLAIGATITFLMFLAGRSLQRRQRRTFCLVMSGICLLQIPWGTAIGICAINVLNRPSVRILFEPTSPPPLL